jgi:hypothetical protein
MRDAQFKQTNEEHEASRLEQLSRFIADAEWPTMRNNLDADHPIRPEVSGGNGTKEARSRLMRTDDSLLCGNGPELAQAPVARQGSGAPPAPGRTSGRVILIQNVLGLVCSSHTQPKRLFAFWAGLLLMLVVGSTSALAQGHVYWAGDKIRRANLDGSNQQVVWNFPGSDVAVDPVNGKIFWAANSGITGTIMMANLNGTGSPTTLLTTTWIDQLQIDVGSGKIYWDDVGNNRIYRSNIISPSVQMLPVNPMTLRAFALDLRPSKLHLYYIDSGNVYRADLNGSNPTQLPNSIGDIFFGIAIDTCTDHLIATGVSNAINPNFPLIIRADLSDAGNETTILQDPMFPDLNVGQNPAKIMLDLNAGTMYWVVPLDGGMSTIRRAYLNGTVVQPTLTFPSGPTVIAQGSAQGANPFASGIALELTNTTCTTVGVNKDMQNNTGQIANNIEIVLAGSYVNVAHYDGYPANLFSSFTESPAAGGNTLLTWSNPNNDVQPGQIAHVGFVVPGSLVNILSVSWTHNATTIGCVSQVSTNTHLAGSSGSQVTYANNCLRCKSVPRYVGGLTVEWYAHQVPLAQLNPRTRRKPIRTDVIRRAPILLAPKATASVDVPEAPPNALFGVVTHKVSTNPRLSGPDVTTDFLEFPVTRKRSAGGPATQSPARTN